MLVKVKVHYNTSFIIAACFIGATIFMYYNVKNLFLDWKKFCQGLYQKAEALYQMGDFEYALVFYHRGHKLRPELQEFRLGIQKAQEAIINCVGSEYSSQ